MASTLTVRVDVLKDGVPIPGFPVTRRVQADVAQAFDIARADNPGVFSTLPITEIDAVQALVLTTDRDIRVRFQNQSTEGLKMRPGGVIIVLDADIDEGPSNNVTVENASGEVVTLRGLATGSPS